MNFQAMLINAVNYYRQYEQHNQLHPLPETRFKNAVVALDVSFAELAAQIGWFMAKADRKAVTKDELLVQYTRVLRGCLLVANLRNWNRNILVDDQQLAKLGRQLTQTDFSKLYLATKNMLNAAYFKHSETDFNHAWKLLLKLGLADLHFSQKEIATEFDHQCGVESIDHQ
ncbi:2-deoxyuridine 5-triphosphate nucleotidohydrolase [Nicoliella spurrieriana]|uniref:2-deoxyuridine 5-triphosphate nucleotidohydrolase n=1 Tax=Nicoliella spurrieriana TaxID=2925830 RepID=A0A976RRQ3_9LACO|nr:2-deoxyuridine 5-triphosphate nucleotidohydrolase [Nicoliella spurrieriana]UQS86660.1 2-deoxyuridine 5-triphosphate nucleotidohydrolase [Nicoliella spurrieriana]